MLSQFSHALEDHHTSCGVFLVVVLLIAMTKKTENTNTTHTTENYQALLRLRNFIHLLLPRDGLLVRLGKSSGSCVISVLL